MLKVLKWVVGVPVGIFALMVVWQLLFGKARDPLQNALGDCRANAGQYMTSDPARFAAMIQQCDDVQASMGRMNANPTKVYGPNGQEK